MIMNLFSVFDPSTSGNLSLNWLIMVILIFFMFMNYWKMESRLLKLILIINKGLKKEFKSNFDKMNYKVFFIFISMFWFLFLSNFLGLFPYIFTATSHLSVTMSMSLVFWLSFMIFGWLNKVNLMFSHLVPLGSPIYLASFMVLIETVSNLIRPITLSVRLAANMIAGHLLLTLLSNLSEMNFLIFPLSYVFILSLMMLEMAVSLIQSYVFITLLSLYLNEI